MLRSSNSCGVFSGSTRGAGPELHPDDRFPRLPFREPAEKRRQIVWQIEKYLAEDGGRSIIFHPRFVTCSYPEVKGITVGVNSPYKEHGRRLARHLIRLPACPAIPYGVS